MCSAFVVYKWKWYRLDLNLKLWWNLISMEQISLLKKLRTSECDFPMINSHRISENLSLHLCAHRNSKTHFDQKFSTKTKCTCITPLVASDRQICSEPLICSDSIISPLPLRNDLQRINRSHILPRTCAAIVCKYGQFHLILIVNYLRPRWSKTNIDLL